MEDGVDVISDFGALFLGSRFRRLAERLQADAVALHHESGLPIQAAHNAVLLALEREDGLAIGDLAAAAGSPQPVVTKSIARLAELGFVSIDMPENDQRVRRVSLTKTGRSAVLRSRLIVWPRIEAAVNDLMRAQTGPMLDQIAAMEAALAAQSLLDRARAQPLPALRIVGWEPSRAAAFKAINEEWITAMYALEKADIDVLDHPLDAIIKPGGDILFAEAEGVGLIGTCALQRTGPDAYELIKMGVYEAARGLGAGDLLLNAGIARAKEMGARKLFLLTNQKSQTAIRLYERAGFVHSGEIMRLHGAEFERCDVAMDYPL